MHEIFQVPPSKWRLIHGARGNPLYWLDRDGVRRAPSNPPPVEEWESDMTSDDAFDIMAEVIETIRAIPKAVADDQLASRIHNLIMVLTEVICQHVDLDDLTDIRHEAIVHACGLLRDFSDVEDDVTDNG